MHWTILLGAAIAVFTVISILVYVFVIKKTPTTSTSSSPIPSVSPSSSSDDDDDKKPFIRGRSRIPVGVKPNFSSVKTLAANNNATFNYVNSPLQTGSTGYLLYNNKSNMFDWGFSLPLNFTHARLNGKIFEFENPNSSDTYGAFVDEYGVKITSQNFFTSKIELGTFF
jgi:hypothetical protein